MASIRSGLQRDRPGAINQLQGGRRLVTDSKPLTRDTDHLSDDRAVPVEAAEFRAIFDAAPTPLLVVAPPDWRIVTANEARLLATGLTLDQQAGRLLFDVFPDDPDDPDADGVKNLTASLIRVMETRASDTMAVQRYAVKDNHGRFEERWWSPVNTPVLDDDGEVALVVHRVEEVTEIVRLRGEAEARDQIVRDQQAVIDRLRVTERELRSAQELNRRILTSSADCIKVLDLDSRVEFMSEGAMCALEVDDFSTVKGTCWPELWPDDERSKTLAALDNAKRGGVGRFQGFATTMKGSPRWWDVIVTPINGLDGRPEKLLSISRDVSEIKRVEEQLRKSEARLRFLGELDEALGASSNSRTAMAAALALLGRRLNASRCAYADMGDDGDSFVIRADYVAPDVVSSAGAYTVDVFGSRAAAELRAGRVLVVSDVAAEVPSGEGQEMFLSIGVGAIVCCPLIKDDRLAAMMAVHQSERREWLEDEVRLISAVAARCWAHVQRVGAEARLADRERRLSAIISTAPIGILVADAAGAIVEGNRRTEEILGHPILHSPDVESYRDWVSFHPNGVQVEGREYPLARALGGEPRPELVCHYLRGDGRRIWVRIVGSPILDESGEIEGALVAILDIDEMKRAQEELKDLNVDLEARVRSATADLDRVWRNARDAFVVIDRDGVFRRINPATTAILGWTSDEMVGRNLFDFILPDDDSITRGALEHARTDLLAVVENRYRTKDGDFRHLSWVAAPEGGLIYAYGRDITAERAREAELEQTREALRQSQKMEAVGQLTGGIAHDFNNMLAVVIGSLDLLGRRIGPADLRAKRYVDAAADGARRAALLTQRLLAFARQQPLQPEALNANRLVAGMSELIRGSLGSDIRLETVLAAGVWRVHADPNQLENVLLNLAVNARDAMPGGGRLTIETQNAHLDARYAASEVGVRPGHYVLIAVTDTGCGMPEEVIAKVFDPFFTTKPVGRGTGLGLSQVYGFVKQSGGHVRIYSELDNGTTVKIYLPRLFGADHDAAETASSAEMPLGDALEVILVVEDEPSVRQFSVDALNELGYKVLEAEGAAAALRLLDAHPEIALLFTDIVMPDVNGGKLAELARKKRPDLRVLFTTGYTRNAVVHNGVVDPGVQLIGKPFMLDELAAKVREVLDAPSPG
jgi:PAS domain S-box-containing protein